MFKIEYKQKLRVLITITIILAIGFIILMLTMIKQNGECIDNPFQYSAKRLNESGGNYYCSCQALTMDLYDFSFNETGIQIIRPIDISSLDLSNIEFNGGIECQTN